MSASNSHGTILSWNRGAQAVFGYTPEEIVGQPLTLLMPERYREACVNGLSRVQATGEWRLHGKTVELCSDLLYAVSLTPCCLPGRLCMWRGFEKPRNLGLVTGADGMMRLSPGLVRIPDVAFVSWERFPERRVPDEPIPDIAPDLAVEVLSPSNTSGEMARKLREYFAVGVQVVWLIDPRARTVAVYTAPEQSTVLDETSTLDGGTVLPGFALPLRELFAELDRQGSVA